MKYSDPWGTMALAAVDDMNDVTLDDNRAQLTTPLWMPALLIGSAIFVVILNEVFLHIVPPRGPLAAEHAPDPTSQFVLLAVAVATVALTKVVGWYRRRSADG